MTVGRRSVSEVIVSAVMESIESVSLPARYSKKFKVKDLDRTEGKVPVLVHIRPDKPSSAEVLGGLFSQYCANSTIHGVHYLGDPSRHWLERYNI